MNPRCGDWGVSLPSSTYKSSGDPQSIIMSPCLPPLLSTTTTQQQNRTDHLRSKNKNMLHRRIHSAPHAHHIPPSTLKHPRRVAARAGRNEHPQQQRPDSGTQWVRLTGWRSLASFSSPTDTPYKAPSFLYYSFSRCSCCSCCWLYVNNATTLPPNAQNKQTNRCPQQPG